MPGELLAARAGMALRGPAGLVEVRDDGDTGQAADTPGLHAVAALEVVGARARLLGPAHRFGQRQQVLVGEFLVPEEQHQMVRPGPLQRPRIQRPGQVHAPDLSPERIPARNDLERHRLPSPCQPAKAIDVSVAVKPQVRQGEGLDVRTGTAIVSVPVIGIVVRLLPGLVVGVNGGPAAETMHSRGSPEQSLRRSVICRPGPWDTTASTTRSRGEWRLRQSGSGQGRAPVNGFRHLLVSRSRTGVANRGHSESCWRLTTRSGRCPSLRSTPWNLAVTVWPGAFRYEAAMATGGPNLLQAVNRNAFIAPGMTGCRRRIVDRPDRQARHAADVLEQALP